jgi:small subunit ribosomal protein S16
VVQDARTRRDGPAKETLGWYDPVSKDKQYEFDLDRVGYWVSHGAQPSEKARALLKRAGFKAPAKGRPSGGKAAGEESAG